MTRLPRRRHPPRPVASTPDETLVGEPVVPGLDIVDVRLERVQEELTAAVGGASLCAISHSAGSVPAAKHLEGRMAALMALRRSLRRGDRLKASLAGLLDEWRRGLDDVMARDAGPDWRAYRAGGVDELEELADRLADPAASPWATSWSAGGS